MMKKVLFAVVSVLALALAGCDDGGEKETAGVFLQQEEPGENCAYGGVRTAPATGDPVYVCESASGLAAAVAEIPAGDACPDGGVEVHYAGSVLSLCNDADGGVTVTPVPAGPSCPAGGLSVTDAGGTSYICSEEAMSLALEAPGANCAAGGVAVTDASGVTWYVCHGADGLDGASTPGSLCPEETDASYSPGEEVYALIEGGVQGTFPGAATMPDGTTGAIQVAATCHSMTAPTDMDTGLPTGKPSLSPYYLIFKADPSLPSILEALSTNELVFTSVRVYAGVDPTLSVNLGGGARILSVEQLTLPDHERPGVVTEYLRVGFGYTTFELVDEETGELLSVTDISGVEGPGFQDGYSPETDRCEVTSGVYPLKFMTLTGLFQGEIAGGATHSAEAGAIEVFSLCQATFNNGFPMATGPYTMRPVVITKAVDQASPRLMQALLNAESLTGSVHFYRLDELGTEEHYDTLTLTQIRVIDIEQVVQGGTRVERLTLIFDSLSHTWVDSQDTTSLNWSGMSPD